MLRGRGGGGGGGADLGPADWYNFPKPPPPRIPSPRNTLERRMYHIILYTWVVGACVPENISGQNDREKP